MWVYDIVDNHWMHLSGNQSVNMQPDMLYPGGLSQHAMQRVGSDLYVFGGIIEDAGAKGMSLC